MADSTRACLWCGGSMESRAPQARYCGQTCKQMAHYARRPEAFAAAKTRNRARKIALSVSVAEPPKPCETCGAMFQPRQRRSRFCSRQCGRKSNPARTWNQRRRAIAKGDEAARLIRREAIGDRDGWICGLCCEPVDRDLAHPDPMSQSLDHIVPLSRGGTHSDENVQISHLLCNLRKGDRPVALAVEQLLPTG